jgi:hypothetical protein
VLFLCGKAEKRKSGKAEKRKSGKAEKRKSGKEGKPPKILCISEVKNQIFVTR